VIPRHWRTAAGRGYAAREVGTARARIRRRQLAAIILVACAVTPVFNVLTSEASLGSAIQGLIDAVLISLLVGGYLMFVRDGWLRPWFRRLGFWADLALSSAIVLYAKRTGLDLVASGALLDRLALPPDIEATRCGELALRGKEVRVVAYGLGLAAVKGRSTMRVF